MGKGAQTWCTPSVGSKRSIWLVAECLDVEESEDATLVLISTKMHTKIYATDLISNVSMMAPQPMSISSAVI